MEHLLLDSTVIRAHPCAAGALKKHGGQDAQALGRSRGGFSTKIHVNVDALGNPLRFTLTGGQSHDITQSEALIAGYEGEYVIADKSYDADAFRQTIKDSGAKPVIPPRSNRKEPCDYDKHLYKELALQRLALSLHRGGTCAKNTSTRESCATSHNLGRNATCPSSNPSSWS